MDTKKNKPSVPHLSENQNSSHKASHNDVHLIAKETIAKNKEIIEKNRQILRQ
jgi:hypothetical protein